MAVNADADPDAIGPDAIGPDGTVRLRCYLPLANSVWFSAGSDGLAGCGQSAPLGVQAAIDLLSRGQRPHYRWEVYGG
jgi:hypothetical protein